MNSGGSMPHSQELSSNLFLSWINRIFRLDAFSLNIYSNIAYVSIPIIYVISSIVKAYFGPKTIIKGYFLDIIKTIIMFYLWIWVSYEARFFLLFQFSSLNFAPLKHCVVTYPMVNVCELQLILTPWLMEPGGSMQHSQEFISNPYPEPGQPNAPHWYLSLQDPF